MGQLIDTSVLIQMERKRLTLGDLIARIPEEDIAISSITASELLVGVERATDLVTRSRRSVFVEHLLREIPVAPLDLDVARIHAVIRVELASSGTPIGPHDLIIAATALALDYDVVTENINEFSRVPRLTTVQPSW